MIVTVIALAIGLLLVVVLWTLSQRNSDRINLFEDPSVKLLPPAKVVNALFDPRDRDFALAQKSPELLAMLETQRRSLALLWLSSIRREALSAISTYRASARGEASIKLGAELRLFSQSLMFLGLHSLLVLLVWNVSVFRVRRLLRQLHDLSLPLLGYAEPMTTINTPLGG